MNRAKSEELVKLVDRVTYCLSLICLADEMKFAGEVVFQETVTSDVPTVRASICVQVEVEKLYRYNVWFKLAESLPSNVMVSFVMLAGASAMVTELYQST